MRDQLFDRLGVQVSRDNLGFEAVLKDPLDGQRPWSPFLNHSCYLTTVAETGIIPSKHSFNSLINAEKSIKAAVLAEPSPWTVIQGVIAPGKAW